MLATVGDKETALNNVLLNSDVNLKKDNPSSIAHMEKKTGFGRNLLDLPKEQMFWYSWGQPKMYQTKLKVWTPKSMYLNQETLDNFRKCPVTWKGLPMGQFQHHYVDSPGAALYNLYIICWHLSEDIQSFSSVK
jgi:hypothetical protein